MSGTELRIRLIEKIQKTENEDLLREASRLLGIGSRDEEVYILNACQKEAIEEARSQILNGISLTNEQSTKEIEEWLGE